MGIILSPAFALTQLTSLSAAMPIIAWQSVVTFSNVAADSEAVNFPATNLANSATNLKWVSGSTVEQFVTTLFTSSDKIDYAAIARHNLGSEQTEVTVEGLPPGGDPEVEGDWDEIVPQQLLTTDGPALFRFTPIYLTGLRLKLASSVTAPQVAIFRVGSLIVLPVGIRDGHVPINFARTVKTIAPRMQNGDFVGQVVLAGGLKTQISLANIDPDWYRANLEPLRAAGAGETFFWAWSPQKYPTEVGYCWTTSDPQPALSQSGMKIDINFDIGGIAV